MFKGLLDFLGRISGYKQQYEQYRELYRDAASDLIQCSQEKAKLAKDIEQLKLLVPHPSPPDVPYAIEKDSVWIQAALEDLDADIVRLPLDGKYVLTNKESFLDIIAWDWVDSWEWIKDRFDCENHAIAFKSHVDLYFGLNQVGVVLDYKAGHAYNLVIFPSGEVMLLEPQSDQLFYWEDAAAIVYVLKGSYVLI